MEIDKVCKSEVEIVTYVRRVKNSPKNDLEEKIDEFMGSEVLGMENIENFVFWFGDYFIFKGQRG